MYIDPYVLFGIIVLLMVLIIVPGWGWRERAKELARIAFWVVVAILCIILLAVMKSCVGR